MSKNITPAHVHVSIAFAPSLGRALYDHKPLQELVSQASVQGLTAVMTVLGIPGIPDIHLTLASEQALPGEGLLFVYCNDRSFGYSDELLRRVYSYVNGTLPAPSITPVVILAWLLENIYATTETTDHNQAKAVEFLSLACVEIVKRQPNILLGLDQVIEFISSLPTPESALDWPPEPAWLQPILSKVLSLNISIADTGQIATIASKGGQRSQVDIAEDIIATLCPDHIDVQLPWDYLKEITIAREEIDSFGLMGVRRDVLQVLGLHLPTFRFVSAEHLKPGSFSFTINHVVMLPWMGLRSGQYIVLEPTDQLASHGVQVIPVVNPLTDLSINMIDLMKQDLPAGTNLTKLDQMVYLKWCFDESLQEYGPCFLHLRFIEEQLVQLKAAYPALIQAIYANVSTTLIVQVLRALVAEKTSIRNLKLILESLLEYSYKRDAPFQEKALQSAEIGSVVTPISDDVVAFVRAQILNRKSDTVASVVT